MRTTLNSLIFPLQYCLCCKVRLINLNTQYFSSGVHDRDRERQRIGAFTTSADREFNRELNRGRREKVEEGTSS